MIRACQVLLASLLILTSSVFAATGPDVSNGRLCLGTVVAPNDDPKNLSNPPGENPSSIYSVKVEGFETVNLSHETGVWIENLNTGQRYGVIIYRDGERIESFYLRFPIYVNSLCLFISPLYQTWQVRPWDRADSWCGCDSPSDGS